MPYPSKTNADEILAAARELLEQDGEERVTIRGVAKRLALSPNALYRYYDDHAALLAALASEGARTLLAQVYTATDGKPEQVALFALADSYVAFALRNPALYKLMMRKHDYTPEQEKPFQELWQFVQSRVEPVVPHRDVAAVSAWALLHGMIGLEQANVFHEGKPNVGVRLGMEALIAGFNR